MRTLNTNDSVGKVDTNQKNLSTAAQSPPVKGYHYDLSGNCADCVTRYLELTGKSRSELKHFATPCLDDAQLQPEDFEKSGQLGNESAKIVLKCLWCARLTRPDIY